MIEIVNRQRRRRMDSKAWRKFGEQALREIDCAKRDATIVFVSDRNIRDLNRHFRQKNRATDVLSFPTKAKQNRLSFQNEIEQLILHGLLHLCGYDHETDKGEMNRLELKLRRKLGI